MRRCNIRTSKLKNVSYFHISDEITLFEYYKRILDFVDSNKSFTKNFPDFNVKYYSDSISLEDNTHSNIETLVVGDWVVLTPIGIFSYNDKELFELCWKPIDIEI